MSFFLDEGGVDLCFRNNDKSDKFLDQYTDFTFHAAQVKRIVALKLHKLKAAARAQLASVHKFDSWGCNWSERKKKHFL